DRQDAVRALQEGSLLRQSLPGAALESAQSCLPTGDEALRVRSSSKRCCTPLRRRLPRLARPFALAGKLELLGGAWGGHYQLEQQLLPQRTRSHVALGVLAACERVRRAMHASLHGADTLSDGTTTLVLRSTFSKMTYPELMTMLNVTTAALGFQAPRYDFVYLPWAKLAFVNFEDPASCKAYFTVFRNVCNLGAEHPGISAVAEAFVQGLARNLAFFLAKCGWKAVSDPRAPCVFSGGVPVSLAEAIRSHVSQEVLLDEEQRARASRAAGHAGNTFDHRGEDFECQWEALLFTLERSNACGGLERDCTSHRPDLEMTDLAKDDGPGKSEPPCMKVFQSNLENQWMPRTQTLELHGNEPWRRTGYLADGAGDQETADDDAPADEDQDGDHGYEEELAVAKEHLDIGSTSPTSSSSPGKGGQPKGNRNKPRAIYFSIREEGAPATERTSNLALPWTSSTAFDRLATRRPDQPRRALELGGPRSVEQAERRPQWYGLAARSKPASKEMEDRMLQEALGAMEAAGRELPPTGGTSRAHTVEPNHDEETYVTSEEAERAAGRGAYEVFGYAVLSGVARQQYGTPTPEQEGMIYYECKRWLRGFDGTARAVEAWSDQEANGHVDDLLATEAEISKKIVDAHLFDLGRIMVREAFPAEAVEEDSQATDQAEDGPLGEEVKEGRAPFTARFWPRGEGRLRSFHLSVLAINREVKGGDGGNPLLIRLEFESSKPEIERMGSSKDWFERLWKGDQPTQVLRKQVPAKTQGQAEAAGVPAIRAEKVPKAEEGRAPEVLRVIEVCQCLLHTPLLRQHLRETCPEPPEEPWLAELLNLSRLMDGAKRKGARYVDLPRRLQRLITEASEEFAFGRQADAHEALMLLLSRWLNGCVKVGDGSGDCSKLGYAEKEQLEASSMVGHVFSMLMGSRVACNACSYESLVTRVEYCLCLTVTLGMTDEELQKCRQESAEKQMNRWCLRRPLPGRTSESSASPTSLAKLLDEYTKEEHIADFKCEKCKKQGACRTSFLRRRPNVFVVYIDRRQDTNLFGKINRRVSFPLELDLSPWIPASDRERFHRDQNGEGLLYQLYAMCVHHDLRGSTASGHYVAYARDRHETWYHIDDEMVRQVQWCDVEEQHPYLLFYMAQHPVELGEPVPSTEETGDPEPAQHKPAESDAEAVLQAPSAPPEAPEPQPDESLEEKVLQAQTEHRMEPLKQQEALVQNVVASSLMALFNYATSNGTGPGSVWWQTPFGLGPEEEKHFLRCSVHDRTQLAGELSAVSGIFPPWVYCYHGVRGLIYALSCCLHVGYAIYACRVDLQHSLLSAFARVTLWTAVLEICGFGNMTGPLGRNQSFLEPLWYRLTAGTLKQPLLPFSAFPRKRGPADQLLFLLYLCSASAFLISPLPLDESLAKLRFSVLLLTLLCLLDREALDLKGLLAASLSSSRTSLCQVAKMGPWFPEVLPSMLGFCPFLPQCLKEKMFRRDAGGRLQVLRFSPAAGMASACVVLLEIFCPGLLVCPWERLQTTGVVLAVGLHLCIVFLMPPGAVGEWNLFNAASTAYLFGIMDTQPLQSDPGILASPLLIFVALMVLGGPLLANWRPDAVGNHFALRKYTGNHPYHTFLIRRSAAWKMQSFKTFAPLASAPPSTRQELLSRAAFHSLVRGRLNLRRALDILVLALPAQALEDVVWFDLGFLLSQTLLDVSFLDRQLLAELGQSFEAGELYSFRVSSFPTFTRWPHWAPWELLDVGAGLEVASGHVSADETFECRGDSGSNRVPLLAENFKACNHGPALFDGSCDPVLAIVRGSDGVGNHGRKGVAETSATAAATAAGTAFDSKKIMSGLVRGLGWRRDPGLLRPGLSDSNMLSPGEATRFLWHSNWISGSHDPNVNLTPVGPLALVPAEKPLEKVSGVTGPQQEKPNLADAATCLLGSLGSLAGRAGALAGTGQPWAQWVQVLVRWSSDPSYGLASEDLQKLRGALGRVADELHLVLGLLDQHLEAGLPAPLRDASSISEDVQLRVQQEAARRAAAEVAGRAAGVAGTAAGFRVTAELFSSTVTGTAAEAALAAGDFVPMPRVEDSGDGREPLPRPAPEAKGAKTAVTWISSGLTLLFWVCIFFLDIVIVVGMQIFLESIGRKRTGREIMSQKAMANALAKAATGGPTGAPIPEPSAAGSQRLSVLSQEELLAHLLAEHWVKIVIGLGLAVALRLPQLFLSEEGVVFHMLFTLVTVLRCMSPVMLWFRDEMGLPKKGKSTATNTSTGGVPAAAPHKHSQ
ncbi:UBP19, partial [Symbiodinium sp. KB8]